jgi:hypothetical protein
MQIRKRNSIKRKSAKRFNKEKVCKIWNFANERLNKSYKNASETLSNILGKVEDGILGLEDKVYELEHSKNNKILKNIVLTEPIIYLGCH